MAVRFNRENLDPNQEQLYCNSCHQFTADAQFVTMDSASNALRPAQQQCFGCHEMRELFANFDPAKDPHGGSCGMCHNPHTDVKPTDALKSCADAGCHANWRSVAFHAGKAHQKVAEQCLTCHQPHAARVDASDCTGCHTAVRQGGGAKKPPLPFDTLKALRQSALPAPPASDSAGWKLTAWWSRVAPAARVTRLGPTSHPGIQPPESPLSPTPSPIRPTRNSPA